MIKTPSSLIYLQPRRCYAIKKFVIQIGLREISKKKKKKKKKKEI